jgi:hypothetical protein
MKDNEEIMPRIRDLFAGYAVSLAVVQDVWAVRLMTPDGVTASERLYGDLSGALDAVHEWALVLGDEEEVEISAEDALNAAAELDRRLRETQVHEVLGEGGPADDESADSEERERLRSWFERQMED